MATSNDHPGLPFVQAAGYTRGRPDGPPLWIVVHDMEASEHSARAESTAAYFANPGDGRSVSSHYCVDDNSVVQCVDLDDVAWTVGNRPGNNRGINWELSGFARQSRDEWLDPFGVAMFARMAPIVRADAKRFGIPLRRLSVAELKAFTPGVTSHNDLRLAFGVTDHTDPGPAFPWDYFIAAMQGGAPTVEDDMPIYARTTADQTVWVSDGLRRRPISLGASVLGTVRYVANEAALNDMCGPADSQAVKVELTPEQLQEIEDAAREGAEAGAPSAKEIADAVVDEEHSRLAE